MTQKIYYNLFLDDEREPRDVKWVELPLVHWTIVRNYDEFVEIITRQGVPANVTFDHDLADEHYKEYVEMVDPKLIGGCRIRYERFKEKTGRDCAVWLANYCLDRGLPLPIYYVHTLNGEGAKNIISVMESARKVQEDKL